MGRGHTDEDFAILLEQAASAGLELKPEDVEVDDGPVGTTGTPSWRSVLTMAQRRCRRPGHIGVDFEQRVDFDRLRATGSARAQAALDASECGAFLLFDFYNIRYVTQTWIGGALATR